jgi:hypothetical protein
MECLFCRKTVGLVDVKLPVCVHDNKFHKSCIRNWLKIKPNCPNKCPQDENKIIDSKTFLLIDAPPKEDEENTDTLQSPTTILQRKEIKTRVAKTKSTRKKAGGRTSGKLKGQDVKCFICQKSGKRARVDNKLTREYREKVAFIFEQEIAWTDLERVCAPCKLRIPKVEKEYRYLLSLRLQVPTINRQSPPEPPVPQQTAAEKHRQAILKRYEHLLVSLESKEPMKSLVDVLFEKEPVAVDHMWKAFLKEARLSMLAIAKKQGTFIQRGYAGDNGKLWFRSISGCMSTENS